MQKDIELWARILQEAEKPLEERSTEAELTQEASVDDILAAFNKKKADEEAQAAQERTKETEYIREIIITDAKKLDNYTCQVVYDIIWSTGKTEKNKISTEKTNDDEFQRVKRQIHSRDDLSVAVALLQQAFDSNSRKPIKWTFINKYTGIKADNSQFSELVNAKKVLSRVKNTKINPADIKNASEFAKREERAAALNKRYGSSKLKYSAIPV